MLIQEVIKGFSDTSADVEVVADKVVEHLLQLPEDELRTILQPMVLNLVKNDVRTGTRTHERLAYPDRSALAVKDRTDAPEYDPVEHRRNLVVQTFISPLTNTMAVWGKATAEEHLAYAAAQRTRADGLIRTAEIHEEAAREIQVAGVACLEEIRAVLIFCGWGPRRMRSPSTARPTRKS